MRIKKRLGFGHSAFCSCKSHSDWIRALKNFFFILSVPFRLVVDNGYGLVTKNINKAEIGELCCVYFSLMRCYLDPYTFTW